VVLSLDAELQENPIGDRASLSIPRLANVIPPTGDPAALAEAAGMLVGAENPVIVCDRMSRTPAGMARLVELAETLQCAVVDRFGRMNFPSRHPLNQTFRSRAVLSQADVILAIEVNDVWGALNAFSDRIVRTSRSIRRSGAQTISLGNRDLYMKSNYQDFARYQEVDLAIAGRRMLDEGRKACESRGKKLAAAYLATIDRAKSDATIGWDASSITRARLCAEIYAQIKDEDWSLAANGISNAWPLQLWNFDKCYRWVRRAGPGWATMRRRL
jgi:acetolactate synthase-1/2/3 large subunit